MSATLQHEVHTAPEAEIRVVEDERPFRRDIQGLRAIAVTLVVLYHAHVPGINAGYVGVDVFFVISGFLITGQILREVSRSGRLSLPSFYARRMRRLLPAALLVVVTTVVVARLWGPVLQLRSTTIDAVFTAGYAINYRLAAEGVDYQQVGGPVSPLQHFWSLAVEEQFYLLWPILILAIVLLARRSRRALVVGVGLVALFGVAGSLYASVVVTAQSAPEAYFSVQTRAWEFGIGALIAIGATQLARIHSVPRAAATWVGLAMIVGSAVLYNDATPFPGIAALLPVAGCALVIAGGCGLAPRAGVGTLLDRRPFQLVGTASYSWYLWHWPMLILLPVALGLGTMNWIQNLEIVLLALWLAAITYVVIERPTRRGKRLRTSWLVRGLLLSGVAALIAIVIGASAPRVVGSGIYVQPLTLTSSGATELTAALVEASTTRVVPGNLTPALQDASDDVPVTESGCHLNFFQVVNGPCVYGDPKGTSTVVLFGDSHAQQWDGALDVAAKAKHWKVVSWTKAACPIAAIRVFNPELNRRYLECEQWRRATITAINAMHPALVIASQSDSVPGRSIQNTQWAAQTALTLQSLQHPGTSVLFIADTPYPRSDIPTCVAAHLNDVRPCELATGSAYHSTAYYTERHQLMVTTLTAAKLPLLDPINWFCSPTLCPVIVANTLVYRDNSQMSNTYSTLLGPLLEPYLPSAPPTSAVKGRTR